MARSKSESTIRKHLKLTEETARILNERFREENINKSEYTRYRPLYQSEHPRSRELELEVMQLGNEINRIRVIIKQIVENSNSHMYSKDDKIKLYK